MWRPRCQEVVRYGWQRGNGGESRQIGANFTNARYPDSAGRRMVSIFFLIGYTSDKPGGELLRSTGGWLRRWERGDSNGDVMCPSSHWGGLNDVPINAWITFPNVPRPVGCWVAGRNRLIFATQSGDTKNLWETGISQRTGRVSGSSSD